jgi:hypothetical protein
MVKIFIKLYYLINKLIKNYLSEKLKANLMIIPFKSYKENIKLYFSKNKKLSNN